VDFFKKRVQGDIDTEDLVVSTTGLKEAHNEMLTGQCYGELLGNQHDCCTSEVPVS